MDRDEKVLNVLFNGKCDVTSQSTEHSFVVMPETNKCQLDVGAQTNAGVVVTTSSVCSSYGIINNQRML